jgi:hypothetical protein
MRLIIRGCFGWGYKTYLVIKGRLGKVDVRCLELWGASEVGWVLEGRLNNWWIFESESIALLVVQLVWVGNESLSKHLGWVLPKMMTLFSSGWGCCCVTLPMCYLVSYTIIWRPLERWLWNTREPPLSIPIEGEARYRHGCSLMLHPLNLVILKSC